MSDKINRGIPLHFPLTIIAVATKTASATTIDSIPETMKGDGIIVIAGKQ